jgi:hypothetical protein
LGPLVPGHSPLPPPRRPRGPCSCVVCIVGSDEVRLMGQWRGRYLDTGPPRGPGHYAEDGRWWWDDGQQRWFRVTDQEDVLEIEAEDVGGISSEVQVLPGPPSGL